MRALCGYYHYFGDFDPATERCVESDPIGLSGGINTYTYVGSNPANVDRSRRQ
jgi:RHS repeat-associated protein